MTFFWLLGDAWRAGFTSSRWIAIWFQDIVFIQDCWYFQADFKMCYYFRRIALFGIQIQTHPKTKENIRAK